MRKSTCVIVAVSLAAASFTASAAHRKPGMWEATSSMHFIKGGPVFPPEVLARMKQQGIKMPDFSAPHTYRHCVTPEQAAKDEHPDFGPQKDCTMVNANWSGNHFHGDMVCKTAEGESHGSYDGTIDSSGESYSGTFHVTGNNPHMGGQFEMEGQGSGKWLGATCGKDQG